MTHWARFRFADGRLGFGTVGDGLVEEYEGDLFDSPKPSGRKHPRGSVAFEAPCVPSKIIALWNNFHALAAKLGKTPAPRSLYLIKSATSIIGPDRAIRRPSDHKGKIVYEGELAIVIGRRCKDVSVEQAADFIFGHTCFNDITAAEVLNENADFAQWCRSKSYDTFGCLGPVIATHFDWRSGRVTTKLDGALRQSYRLSDMIIAPERVVSEVSHDMTLLPGDVIACGTSVGVGSMRDGSVVEVGIDGIGSLINTFEPG